MAGAKRSKPALMTAHDIAADRAVSLSEISSERRDAARSAGLSVIHVIAGLEAEHGGPSYSVPRLCETLVSAGAHTTLLSVGAAGAGAGGGRGSSPFQKALFFGFLA